MNLERTQDAALVNGIVAEAYGQPYDVTRLVENPANFVLVGEHGVMLFGLTKPGIYAATAAFKEAGRGKWGVDFGRASVAWMFANTDAARLWATVTKGNERAIVTMANAIPITVERTATHCFASITKDVWTHANAA